MSISYGFFDSVSGDRKYNADDISNYFLKLISNGVFATPANAMQVQASSGMTIQVSAGWGFINCKWINNNAPYMLTIDAADVVLNRIDRIVLQLNAASNARNMAIVIKKGTPASNPQPPTLTRVSGGTWELSLAQISVAAGTGVITQAMITDERPDTSVCGWVTGLIDQIDTTNLFAQYDAAFQEWFTDIKETLSTTTLVRQYTSTYTTSTTSETIIPINIAQYNYTLDVLNVYVNGLKLIPGVDYTKNDGSGTITLAKTLTVIGTPVEFEVLKSVDGSEAESVIDMVYQLQTEIGKLDANNYYCNGVNDNVAFQTWLTNWERGHANKGIVNVIGTFGVDTTQYNIDGVDYSFVYLCTRTHGVTLNFSQCNAIQAKENSFAYFSGCKVDGLTVVFDDVTNTAATTAITAENCTLENCDVYGDLEGTAAATAYSVTNCRMIECDCNLIAVGQITGINATKSIVTSCNITVTSDGASTSAYGIDMGDASRCDNSTFTAIAASSSTSASASGGIGGGYYSNCAFIGMGGAKGQGFYVRGGYLLNVNNCIFRGYTEDSVNGWGIGLTGAANDGTTLFLTGINCNQVAVTGYSQTASMTFTAGHGSYMGTFYAAVSTVSTIVSYGRVIRNRV